MDAILHDDTGTLTEPDIASRATWADKFRDSDRNTSEQAGLEVGDLSEAEPRSLKRRDVSGAPLTVGR